MPIAMAITAWFLALLASGHALAFCRTTNCLGVGCRHDPMGCVIDGSPLYWPTLAVDFTVDPAGSPRLGISGEMARGIFERSLRAWTAVDCGGWNPSIQVHGVSFLPDEAVLELGISPTAPNIEGKSVDSGEPLHADRRNTLRFVDEEWKPSSSQTIALTTVTFCARNGEISATDVEMNSAHRHFTVSDQGGDFDLQSVLTHEAGHCWGLADVTTPGPTMFGNYEGAGDLNPRTLKADDIAGICTIYPRGRAVAEERGCGCFQGPRPGRMGRATCLFVLGLLLGYRLRSIRAPRQRDPGTVDPAFLRSSPITVP